MPLKQKQYKKIAVAGYILAALLSTLYLYNKMEDKENNVQFPLLELIVLSLCTAFTCSYLSKLKR